MPFENQWLCKCFFNDWSIHVFYRNWTNWQATHVVHFFSFFNVHWGQDQQESSETSAASSATSSWGRSVRQIWHASVMGPLRKVHVGQAHPSSCCVVVVVAVVRSMTRLLFFDCVSISAAGILELSFLLRVTCSEDTAGGDTGAADDAPLLLLLLLLSCCASTTLPPHHTLSNCRFWAARAAAWAGVMCLMVLDPLPPPSRIPPVGSMILLVCSRFSAALAAMPLLMYRGTDWNPNKCPSE